MTRTAKFEMTGGKEIQKVLKEMPVRLQRKALVHAFRQGANLVKDSAKNKAPSPNFARSITVARGSGRTRPTKNTVVFIALKKPYSRLAHLFEFGTVERHHLSGKSTGRIIAQPFLRPAFDEKSAAATKKIAEVLKENIYLIVKQLTRGQKVSLAKKNRVL